MTCHPLGHIVLMCMLRLVGTSVFPMEKGYLKERFCSTGVSKYNRDFTSFHSHVPLLAFRPHSVGVEYLYWRLYISSISAHPMQDHQVLIYLIRLSMFTFSYDGWSKAIWKSRCVLEMRIPEVIKQCLLFVPLISHLKIQFCSGIFLNVYSSFSSIWLHWGQELCLNH